MFPPRTARDRAAASTRVRVPFRAMSFDALPEELQLKILKLALFEDADEDKSTRAKALSVERLKRPAVVPERVDEEPISLLSAEMFVPKGITRALAAVAAAARLATLSKGLRTLATDERLWAEPLETLSPLYGAGQKEPPRPYNAGRVGASDPFAGWMGALYKVNKALDTKKHIDPRHSDAWPSMSSFKKYEKLTSHVRRLCVDYFAGIKTWTDIFVSYLTEHGRDVWDSTLPGYVITGKDFENYYEEIFTENVTFRVLYNLFGSGFRDGPTDEPGFWALINYWNGDSGFLLDRRLEDEDIELKIIEMCRDEFVGQGYLRRAGAPETEETQFLSEW